MTRAVALRVFVNLLLAELVVMSWFSQALQCRERAAEDGVALSRQGTGSLCG